MPITWLALARLGAAMVPVNVRSTGRELHYALTDSGAGHLVLDAEFLPVLEAMPEPLSALAGRVVVTGASSGGHLSWRALVDAGSESFRPPVEPQIDDLLNIQYTSGTTGLPKGCILTQRYWLVCAKSYADCDGVRYRNLLAGNPFFYMTPQWLLLMAFLQRATLHVAPYRSLSHYVSWMQENAIDFCLFPPDIHAVRAAAPGDACPAMIRGNLYIHRAQEHAEMERRFGFPLRTAFGMTEIGMGTFTPLEAEEMTGLGTCGLAAPFRECRIASAGGEALPSGTTGELQFRGPGLLLGYWGRPEATAAAFHGEWFRSGDLARMDERGFVTIVGRIKEMIRRAGENISATEVETVLLGIPGIAEAAAVPAPDPIRGEEVMACLYLQSGCTPAELSPEQILDRCKRDLAVFKLPRYVVFCTEPLPRSTSGKVRKPELVERMPELLAQAWDRAAQVGGR
jgi:crotonobetaine/carnitine-CoA ligase